MERTKLNVKWDLWKSTHPGCLTQERRLKPGNTTKFLVHAAKGEASLRVMAKGQSCLCAWHMILKIPVQMETQASSRVPLPRNNVSFHSGDNKYKALTNGDGLVGSCRGIAARTWKLGMGCVTRHVTVLIDLNGYIRVSAYHRQGTTGSPVSCFSAATANTWKGQPTPQPAFWTGRGWCRILNWL